MRPPLLDATAGRSYRQSSQAAGALGGRRDVVQWHVSGDASTTYGKIVRVEGAAWRLLGESSRVVTAPSVDAGIDILAQLPGEGYESIFSVRPVIAAGQYISTGGILREDRRILPVGTLVKLGSIGTTGYLGVVALQESHTFGVYDPTMNTWAVRNPDNQLSRTNLKNLNGKFFRIYGDLAVVHDHGDLERSTDGGITWPVSLAAPDRTDDWGITDVCIAPTGSMFAVETASLGTLGGGRDMKIYRSRDDGDSWQLVHTVARNASMVARGGPICADQEDTSGRVFALVERTVGTPGSGFIYTEDDGDTWAYIDPTTSLSFALAPRRSLLTFGINGRLIYCKAYPTDPVYYSDDGGDNWTEVVMAANFTAQRHLIHAEEGILYLCGYKTISSLAAGRIYRSSTNGTTWFIYLQGENITYADPDGIGGVMGMSYDDYNHILYSHCYDIEDVGVGGSRADPILARAEGGDWHSIVGDAESKFISSPFECSERSLLSPVSVGGEGSGVQDLTTELHYRTHAAAQ